MKKITTILGLILGLLWNGHVVSNSLTEHNTNVVFKELKTGDILFQIGNGSDFEEAVIGSTSDIYDKNYSHCGVIYFENDSIFVLEAETENGVVKTNFDDFYRNSKHLVVGRLKPDYQYIIDNAILRVLKLIGKKYDFIFSDENDDYYCSELIQKTFTDNNNNPIFETIPMTFKDKITNETIPYWIEYFEKLNTEIQIFLLHE